jgi:opacity protein-like surface antigen
MGVSVVGLALAAFVALGCLAPSEAQAYERQWHAGVSLGYGLFGDGGASGLGGGLHLTYGLSDAFNAMAEVDATYHPGSERVLASGAVGASYVIDVLRWVPYVGLMAGVYEDIFTGPCPAPCSAVDTRFGLSVPVGLDYQLSRSVAVGVQGRYHLLLTGGSSGVTSALTAFARVEYLWGY